VIELNEFLILIHQLREIGLEIVINGNNYQLKSPLELLDKQAIFKSMPSDTKKVIKQLEVVNVIDSTNSYLLKNCKNYRYAGVVCIAEFQTAGRGRLARSWFAPYGINICLSLFWQFKKEAQLSGLSLVIGLAVRRTLIKYGAPPTILCKWPNDLLYKQAKLAGILIETRISPATQQVVIGVGVNLISPLATTNDYLITDLTAIMQQPIARNHLLGLLLNELLLILIQFEKTGFKPFFAEWQGCDSMIGKKVLLTNARQQYSGLAKGVNENGELLLEDQDGKVHSFINGEVSLRLAEKV